MSEVSLGPINYLTIIIYMGAIVGMGYWFSRRENTSDEYLLGGRKIPWWAVGISYYMSLASTISLVMVPGEIYNNGLSLFVLSILFPITVLLGFFLCVRFFFKLKSFTPFEYLERRYDSRVRLVVSLIYFWIRIAYISMVLFASAKVFEGAAGWSVWMTIPLVAIIGIVYTVLGGIRAVIWTDVFQFVALFGGLAVAIIICTSLVDGGVMGVLSYSFEHGRGPERFAEADFYHFDPYIRLCFWFILLSTIMDSIFYPCADQITIQRLLSTGSYKEAKKAAYMNSFLEIPLTLMLWFVGLAIFTYYSQNVDPRVTSGDGALFTFISTKMPTPLPGLMLAAMLAAAMSTLDSGMNSLSTVVLKDFYLKYLNPSATEEKQVKLARILTIAIGAFAIVVALSIAGVASNLGETVAEAFAIWGSFQVLLAPAFFITVTSRKITSFGIWLGLFTGIGVNSGMITWYLKSQSGWIGAISHNWILIPLSVGVLSLVLTIVLKSRGSNQAFRVLVVAVCALGYTLSTGLWYYYGRFTDGGELSFQWVTFPGAFAFFVVGYSSMLFIKAPDKEKHEGLTLWSIGKGEIKEN